MGSEVKTLYFNGLFTITTLHSTSGTGTFPSRSWIVTTFSFNDNLDSWALGDATVGDIIIDSSRNRFTYQGIVVTPAVGISLREDPWDGQTNDYTNPQLGSSFLFQKTPNCELYQHGRENLGVPEQVVEYLSQKANYQIEEKLCATGDSLYAINILGSTAGSAPTQGQSTGILDRTNPVNGDEWINPENGDRWVYQDGTWQLAPCCSTVTEVPLNILGSNSSSAPTEGLTGGIPDRVSPIEGDEWINPDNGDRWIYQDGMWQLAPCCAADPATTPLNILGSTAGSSPIQGQTGGILDRTTPVEGDEWVNPDNGERWIYQDGTWQLAPFCSPLFRVETATGPTGTTTSGPIDMECGDTLRLWSEGNLYINATEGSARVQLEPDNIFSEPGNPNLTRETGPPDPTRSASYLDYTTGVPYMWDTANLVWVAINGVVRYAATGGFHDPTDDKSAIVRSTIFKGVSVTRSATTGTILSGEGYTYTVDVPDGDDIFYLHIFDGDDINGTSQLGIRITVNWLDTNFVGNVIDTMPTPVGPNIQVVNHGNYAAGSPNFTNAVRVRTPGTGSNDAAVTTFSGRSVTIDIQTADTANVYYSVILAF